MDVTRLRRNVGPVRRAAKVVFFGVLACGAPALGCGTEGEAVPPEKEIEKEGVVASEITATCVPGKAVFDWWNVWSPTGSLPPGAGSSNVWAMNVPAGCDRALVKIWAPGGGTDSPTAKGGGGGYVRAELAVTPGEALGGGISWGTPTGYGSGSSLSRSLAPPFARPATDARLNLWAMAGGGGAGAADTAITCPGKVPTTCQVIGGDGGGAGQPGFPPHAGKCACPGLIEALTPGGPGSATGPGAGGYGSATGLCAPGDPNGYSGGFGGFGNYCLSGAPGWFGGGGSPAGAGWVRTGGAGGGSGPSYFYTENGNGPIPGGVSDPDRTLVQPGQPPLEIGTGRNPATMASAGYGRVVVSWYKSAPACTTTVGPTASFYTVNPCRVLDTRGAVGATGGPALSSNIPRDFPITGLCGIPTTAKAVSVNVTVVGPSAAGDLGFTPGCTSSNPTSTANFTAGMTRANNAILTLAPDGTLRSTAHLVDSGATHMILDVNGYFQ